MKPTMTLLDMAKYWKARGKQRQVEVIVNHFRRVELRKIKKARLG